MKYFRICTAATVALGLAVGITGLASAATISLTGTVRDFNDTHPDFEAQSAAPLQGSLVRPWAVMASPSMITAEWP